MCTSTVHLVAAGRCRTLLHFGTARSQGDLCTLRSASKADLRILESQLSGNDRGEEEFEITPLFTLAAVFFDKNARGRKLFILFYQN